MRPWAPFTIPRCRMRFAGRSSKHHPSSGTPSALPLSTGCVILAGIRLRPKLSRLTAINQLLTAAERKRLAQRAHSAIFQSAVERLRRHAAAFLAMQLRVPERPGGYYHDYVCPRHGVELIFDPQGSRIHRCPADDVRWEGDRFDAAWRWFVNHHLAEASLRMAVLW